jgi:hypothetical protein
MRHVSSRQHDKEIPRSVHASYLRVALTPRQFCTPVVLVQSTTTRRRTGNGPFLGTWDVPFLSGDLLVKPVSYAMSFFFFQTNILIRLLHAYINVRTNVNTQCVYHYINIPRGQARTNWMGVPFSYRCENLIYNNGENVFFSSGFSNFCGCLSTAKLLRSFAPDYIPHLRTRVNRS